MITTKLLTCWRLGALEHWFCRWLGAVTLPNVLIRNGSAVNVASLFYLVPPATAVVAWALFGETLTGLAVLGMVFTGLGVWLARK